MITVLLLLLSYWVAIHGDPVTFVFLWLLSVATEIPKEARMAAATVAAGAIVIVVGPAIDWTHVTMAIMAILVAIIDVVLDHPDFLSLFDEETEEDEGQKKYKVKGWEDL